LKTGHGLSAKLASYGSHESEPGSMARAFPSLGKQLPSGIDRADAADKTSPTFVTETSH
jgi:hypothetical protein